MGRRPYCHNVGKEHDYHFVYPTIGGWWRSYAIYRCEKVCKICRHEAELPEDKTGIWIPGKNGVYEKLSPELQREYDNQR